MMCKCLQVILPLTFPRTKPCPVCSRSDMFLLSSYLKCLICLCHRVLAWLISAHRPDLRFGTPLCPAAASLAACTGFTGGRCFKFCLFPSQCCSPGHSRKPFQGAWASQAACVFPGPMGAVLAHTASSQTGPCLLAGWRRRDDTLPVFCSPRLSGRCSGVNTESSRQQSLVLHELSIKQDVVQLRLEANWLEINYSRLFL